MGVVGLAFIVGIIYLFIKIIKGIVKLYILFFTAIIKGISLLIEYLWRSK